MSTEDYSYDDVYETETESDEVSLVPVKREINNKIITERVPPIFAFALTAGRQETMNDRQLPPNISQRDSKINFKSRNDGSTALMIAAETGKSNLIKQLLRVGITKNAVDVSGNSALIRGAIAGRTNACVYLARKVKKSGIDTQNTEGETAIFVSCRRNNIKLLEKLVKYGGDVNIQTKNGVSPLMVACFYLNLEMIQILINGGANIDAVDNDNSNCLHYMAKSKSIPKVTNFPDYFVYFRKSVATAEMQDRNGNQPLFYALQTDCEPLVNFFLNVTSMKDVHLVYNEDNAIFKEETQENKEVMIGTKSNKIPRALFHRVYKYVPIAERKRYWELILHIKTCIEESPGYFFRITEIQERGKDDDQIHKDVVRSHQTNIHFKTKFSDGQRTLFRVLRAWAIQDELGYVQGMNDLCGYLVLILQEEEHVYWAFNVLMNNNRYNLRQMLLPGFPGVSKSAYVSMKVIRKYHPKIYRHLKTLGYDFEHQKTYMLEYYMYWFSRVFPADVELRLLDIILMEEEIMKKEEFIFVDKALTDPIELMGDSFEVEKFISYIFKCRITSKEIRKWFASVKSSTN
ncbi:Rab-GAP TBC domain-containing protein [Entamoeba marina]